MTMTSEFSVITSPQTFLGFAMFSLPISVNNPSFISISLLTLELWKFIFIYITLSIFHNDWRLRQVKDNFGKNFCNKKLLNAAKCQGLPLLLFLSYWGKTNNMSAKNTSIPRLGINLDVRVSLLPNKFIIFWYCSIILLS